MKLKGSAQGVNYVEVMRDAHRQAGLFFEDTEYELKSTDVRAESEYSYRYDGSCEPTSTVFRVDFVATPREEQCFTSSQN